MDTILLLDFMNFAHRANVKFKSNEKQGYPVIYNFFRNLRAIIEQLSPNRVFFCLEGPNNFRKKLYSDYKANRIVKHGSDSSSNLDKEFYDQVNRIQELSTLLPITQCYADTFEADDIIYSLSHNLKDEDPIIVSNDNDLWQILQEKSLHRVKMYDPFKKEVVVPPKLFHTVFKALNGDTADNIPRLVGEAAAKELTANPNALKQLLSNDEHRKDFELNLDMVRLRLIPTDELQFISYDINYDQLKREFESLEFNSFFKGSSSKSSTNSPVIANSNPSLDDVMAARRPKDRDKGDYWERFVETFKSLE